MSLGRFVRNAKALSRTPASADRDHLKTELSLFGSQGRSLYSNTPELSFTRSREQGKESAIVSVLLPERGK